MNYNPVVAKYCEDVLAGRIVAGKYIRLAVERHLRDIETGRDRGLYFDHAAGQRIIDFAHILNHHKGEKARTPILLEPNQQFYFYVLFGWRQIEDGYRRFFKSYKSVARKNGKTTEGAAKSLYMSSLDGEIGAQNYFVATKEDQAKIGFNDAWKIIKATPGLLKDRKHPKGQFEVYKKSVYVPFTESFMQPVGSDSDTQDGFDPHYALIDEYHAHKTDGMLDVMESGMGARRQPMIDIITTAGFNKEYPCFGFQKMVSDILEGKIENDSIFGLIYSLDTTGPVKDDWQDEETWIKANPNLGASVYIKNLRKFFKEAKEQGGNKEVNFKTKNLNIWTDAEDTWIPDELWGQNGSPIDRNGLIDRPCYGGLDLAVVEDFSALSLRFPMDDGTFKHLYYFWIPEETVARRIDKGLSSLRNWINDGFVKVTSGNVTDFDVIQSDIIKLSQKYRIQSIGADRNLASQLINNLIENGIPVTGFNQGMVSMSHPTKEYEREIRAGRHNHGGNPVMRWMIGNVSVKRDHNGNYRPDKDKSSEKIDGVVADIMAWGEWNTLVMGATGPSSYEEGVIVA